MRVVSLNCWSGRQTQLRYHLASLNADVLCLQEVMSAPKGTPAWLTYVGQGSTEEPQHSTLFKALCELLPEHQGMFFPAAFGYLNDKETTPYPASYGNATFVRTTVPIVGSISGFVYGAYRSKRWGDPPLPRTAHLVRLWDPEKEKAVVIGHFHGLWLPNEKQDTPERVDQATRFIELLLRIQKEGDELIVCGDFNVLPHSELLERLKDVAPRELVMAGGFKDTRTHLYKKSVRFADYMLVSAGIHVDFFDVPQEPVVSDHCPLILDFHL